MFLEFVKQFHILCHFITHIINVINSLRQSKTLIYTSNQGKELNPPAV